MNLKVCGSRDPENIKQIAALKPDYLGFIFYAGSKRYVGEEFVMPAISGDIKKVGVFVNAPASYIIEKIDRYKLDMIQLHGDEKPEFCEVLNHIIPVVKAFGVDESFDLKILDAYKSGCSYFLFDTKSKAFGGSGNQFDWTILNNYDHALPFFLSGGIDLNEVKKMANFKFRAFAIDVNSKFETEPGVKDIGKLKLLKDELSS